MAETKAKKTAVKATKVVKVVKKAPPKKIAKKTTPKKAPTKTVVKKTSQVETKSEAKVEVTASVLPVPDMQAMFDAGCHFGHKVSKWHPKMAPFIYGVKGGAHIFDLSKTAAQLEIVCQHFYDLAKDGKSLLMVGTKRSSRDLLKQTASEMGCFYVASRWMGGLLTNFGQLKKSIKRMNDIEAGLKDGSFDKYTKYERLRLDKERSKLERFFIGLKDLTGKPDCIFVIDPEKEKIVVQEAIREGVEIIALADSNADPRPIDIIIPANDDSSKSVQYIVNMLATAYNAGKAARK